MILEKYKCGLTSSEVVRAFTLARAAGLRTAGTFSGFSRRRPILGARDYRFCYKAKVRFRAFNIRDKPTINRIIWNYDQSGFESIPVTGLSRQADAQFIE